MDARERYDDLADFLVFRHDFVELSQMMGMPCVKARGQAGAWAQLPPGVPHSFACAGPEQVSFLQIHPRLAG